MTHDLRNRLDQLHAALLALHKKLLDHERARYEKIHGQIPSAGHFLQLILNDTWFAWLRPMSGLVAQIDEYVESKKPTDPAEGVAYLEAARKLVTPDENGNEFQKNYVQAIQDSPDIAIAHRDWKRLIGELAKTTG